jgi:peptidoglycan-associated lipoprotein
MRRLALLALAGLVTTALPGCGPKRPPSLSTAVPGQGPAEGAGAEDTTMRRVDTGPDVGPLDTSGLAGEDIPSGFDVTTEGGPLEDIYFDFDQATLTEAAKATLAQHAQWLQARPAVRVTVEGHCDERGTVEYNLALGDKRARATVEYLVSLGIAPERLSPISLGKERPKDPGHGEEAWAKNRRAHLAVTR